MARSASLGQLAKSEPIDREAVDEEVHGLDFLMDVARRRCQSDAPEPIDAQSAARLRLHVADLSEEVTRVRGMDCSDLPTIDMQLHVIANMLRRIHTHANNLPRGAAFRRWGPRPSVLPAESPQVGPSSPPCWTASPPCRALAAPLAPAGDAAKPSEQLPAAAAGE